MYERQMPGPIFYINRRLRDDILAIPVKKLGSWMSSATFSSHWQWRKHQRRRTTSLSISRPYTDQLTVHSKESPGRSREDSLSWGSERQRLAARRKEKKKGGSWRVPHEGWPHRGCFLFCGRSSPRIPFTMDNGIVPIGRINSQPKATSIVNDP